MTKTPQKINLSRSLDIPFNKLVLSQSNVRRTKVGVSIEDLAEDIARRTLLTSISVRPVKDAEGTETGMYEIPAGGRRYRALEQLVKQKRLAKTTPIPCIVREDGIAEEDSLAENVHRMALHPLDQFRAFEALRGKGQSEEEIAAAFFVSPSVVKQRLRLASVAPKILDAYAADDLSLEQLMAFTVTDDHARQEQVFERVSESDLPPYSIKRILTERSVRADDKRVRFVGIDAYTAQGGTLTRDLFESDRGGYLNDVALLEKLVTERLLREAERVKAEGWKWIEVATEFPYGHTAKLLSLPGERVPLSEADSERKAALQAEYDALEASFGDAEDLSDDADERLGELESEIEALHAPQYRFSAEAMANAGVFLSIDHDGALKLQAGFVKPEDRAQVSVESRKGAGLSPGDTSADAPGSTSRGNGITVHGDAGDDEERGLKPLSEKLVTELTAQRTFALRDAVANAPEVAYRALLHALCLNAFYSYSQDTCLEITARTSWFGTQVRDLENTPWAQAIQTRHEDWQKTLPERPGALWDHLLTLDRPTQASLLAHCVSLSTNIVREPFNRRPAALAHGERLVAAVGLDMAEAGWKPTAENYLGRVAKPRILEAVTEACGGEYTRMIDHLKKDAMASEAERLLADTGWLPEPLRPSVVADEDDFSGPADGEDGEQLPAFLADDGEEAGEDDDGADPHVAIAAE